MKDQVKLKQLQTYNELYDMLHMRTVRRKLCYSAVSELRPMPPIIPPPVEEMDLHCYEVLDY